MSFSRLMHAFTLLGLIMSATISPMQETPKNQTLEKRDTSPAPIKPSYSTNYVKPIGHWIGGAIGAAAGLAFNYYHKNECPSLDMRFINALLAL